MRLLFIHEHSLHLKSNPITSQNGLIPTTHPNANTAHYNTNNYYSDPNNTRNWCIPY